MEGIRQRQSTVARIGKEWEIYVYTFLKEKLHKYSDLKLLNLSNVNINRDDICSNIYKALCLDIFHQDRFYEVLGDTDIVVYSKKIMYPIVIISCKVSLHGRLSETLFYALYYRMVRKIRYVLVAPDRGKQSKVDKWESEWGSNDNPTKDRLLATLFLDGVYVKNVRDFMPSSFKDNDSTNFGGIVKPLETLVRDIVNWWQEIYKLNNMVEEEV